MRATDALIKALLARGEREVTLGSASKFRKFTRTWLGQRSAGDSLRPVVEQGTFWFVSVHNGSLRVGSTSAGSRSAKKEVREMLMKEGSA